MRNYIKDKILKIINRLNLDPQEFRSHFRNPRTEFTCTRRQSFSDVVKVGLLSPGSCMKENLRHCFGVGSDRPSASAYIQQRDKLGVQAYRALFDHFRDPDEEFTLVRDKYLLVACDGSDINIHPNKDDAGTLVNLSNNPHGKVCNQLHLNVFSAVPDGHFLDYVIQEHKEMNEIQACAQMMERMPKGPGSLQSIITCDRGYESYHLMMRASSLGLYFCIRAKDINSRSISQRYRGMVGEDGLLDTVITRKYTRCSTVLRNPELYPDYVYVPPNSVNEFIPKSRNPFRASRKGCPPVIDYHEYSFRLVWLKLSENSYEVLLTPARKSSRQGRRRAPRLWRRGWGCHLLLSTGDAMTTRGKTGMPPSSKTAILIFNFENSPPTNHWGHSLGRNAFRGKTTKTRNPKPCRQREVEFTIV